jgi:hypothetical protein
MNATQIFLLRVIYCCLPSKNVSNYFDSLEKFNIYLKIYSYENCRNNYNLISFII